MTTLDSRPLRPRDVLDDVLRTARLPKIAPIPLLAFSGYALEADHDVLRLVWVTVAVLAVSLLVTRLNVATDESLDRATRPELAQSLHRSQTWIVLVSAIELAALVAALVCVDASTRCSLVALLFFGVLYSFNFLSLHPVRTRWKGHWVGHAIAFVGSYCALWTAGAGSASFDSSHSLVLLVAIATSTADYAVYIGECAIDHREEAAAGLRTAAAVLGPRSSALAALALLAVAIALHASWIQASPRLALAFAPPLIARGVLLGRLAWYELRGCPERAQVLRARGADAVFLGARIWAFLVLAFV